MIFLFLPFILGAARHKTNANYENLLSDKVEKKMTNNLFHDTCLTIELG